MAFPHHAFMFPPHEDHHNNHLPSPSCPPRLFNGGEASFMMKRSVSFSGVDKSQEVHMDDELSDDGSHLGEKKKKRLNLEQVKALEKSFELGNKLEPDRKLELAKALGLKPRQVAIWFQNRRARWKTKQLEKDYDVLKKQFDALKADTDALQDQNNKLSEELLCLRTKDSLRPTSMVHLLQGTNLPCTKPDQVVQEEGFCHMFNEVDEQQGFWSWGEQQNIH